MMIYSPDIKELIENNPRLEQAVLELSHMILKLEGQVAQLMKDNNRLMQQYWKAKSSV